MNGNVQPENEPVFRILSAAPVNDSVRHAAWEAFFLAESPTEFQVRFDALSLPNSVKVELWKAKFSGPGGAVATPPPTAPRPDIRMRYAGGQPMMRAEGFELPPLPGLRQPLLNLEEFVPSAEEEPATGYGRFIAGAERGIARAASGLSTLENIGLLGTMKAGPKVLGAVIGGTLSGAAGLYFTYEMAKALVESLPEALKAWRAKDYGRLGEIIGGDAVNALLLGPAAAHTKATVRGALPPVPMSGRVRDLPNSAAGEARLRAEAPAGPAGPVMSREQRRATATPPSTGRHQLRTEIRDPHVLRLRGIAKRLGMDYDTMTPADRAALEQIQHEMNLGALQNIATGTPTWWPVREVR